MHTLLKPLSLRLLPVFLAAFFIGTSIFADAIRLTSGQFLEGKILDESEKLVIIETNKGTLTIRKSEILEMERTGSKDKIAKPLVESGPSITKLILMSFIPGYSPLYYSKERPELGIPFAGLSLYYFYRFLLFQTNSVTVGVLKSADSKTPGGMYINFILGPSLVSQGLNNTPVDSGINYSNSLYVYTNLREVIYNQHRDRVVGGETMTEDEYLKIKKRNLYNYAGVSVANAVFTYLILRNEGGLGAFYKTESNGIRTLFYAFPTMDGGVFAAVSKF